MDEIEPKRRPTPEEISVLRAQSSERRKQQGAVIKEAGKKFPLEAGFLWINDAPSSPRWGTEVMDLLNPTWVDTYGFGMTRRELYGYSGAVVIMDSDNRNVIACALLSRTPENAVESRSEAVALKYQHMGFGSKLFRNIYEAAPLFVKHCQSKWGNSAFEKDLPLMAMVDKNENAAWQKRWLEGLGFHLKEETGNELIFQKFFRNPLFKASMAASFAHTVAH
jgi:hypothetical protein